MKKRLVLMVIIAVLLVGGLTFIGFKIAKQNEPYKTLENDLKFKAESLIGANPSLVKELNGHITLEDLSNNGYGLDLTTFKDKCDGYVEVKQNGQVLKYSSYIKCENYETKGYK